MRTQQRLTEAYQQAMVHWIDKDAKVVIFSDCHRGTGSHQDEFAKNQNVFLFAMDQYFKEGYLYVEAGDGDELWEHPKFEVIRHAHHIVFSSLKRFHDQGRMILLYGNHNNPLRDPAYVRANYEFFYNDFTQTYSPFLQGIKPCEALILRHRETGQEILTVHGQQGDFANDQFWPFTKFSLKYFWRHLHAFGIKNPVSPVKNVHKRHKIEKNFTKWIEKNRIMLICGHTHRFKFPRKGEAPYFNCGCCIYPTSITAMEIAENQIQLVRWRTLYNPEGLLQIKKEILRGPEPLEEFDLRKKMETQRIAGVARREP